MPRRKVLRMGVLKDLQMSGLWLKVDSLNSYNVRMDSEANLVQMQPNLGDLRDF